VSALRSHQTKGLFTSVDNAINQPAKRKPIKKGDALLKGPGFEMQADELTGGGSDIEFVTDPFGEFDVAKATQAANAIVAICTAIQNNALNSNQWITRTDTLGAHGSVKKSDSFVEMTNNITAKPQTTIGLRLDMLFELMKDIGIAQANEGAGDTARRQMGREKLMSQPVPGSLQQPGPALRRVGDATTEVDTAVANYQANNAGLAAWVPSNHLKGLMALLWTYIRAANVNLPNYAKAIAPIMARTDFAKIFKMLPANEQVMFKQHGGQDFVDLMQECPYIQGLNMAQPLFLGVYAGDATKNNQMLAALTRDSWLKGITQGVDQLTQKSFPSTQKSVRAEMESLGSLGKKTDKVGIANVDAPIFELRGLAGGVPFNQWPALVQLVMQYARRKNMGDPRALGE
jgi:hypothetical protein